MWKPRDADVISELRGWAKTTLHLHREVPLVCLLLTVILHHYWRWRQLEIQDFRVLFGQAHWLYHKLTSAHNQYIWVTRHIPSAERWHSQMCKMCLVCHQWRLSSKHTVYMCVNMCFDNCSLSWSCSYLVLNRRFKYKFKPDKIYHQNSIGPRLSMK